MYTLLKVGDVEIKYPNEKIFKGSIIDLE